MKSISGRDENGNPKNGPLELFFKNGLISCQGEFKDGKIVGRWKWFYKTGKPRATGGFDDEKQKHSEWKRYYANGQLWDEARFEHGKKKGTWKVYYEVGELLKSQNFR